MAMFILRLSSRCLLIGTMIFLVLPGVTSAQKIARGSLVRVHHDGAEPKQGILFRMTADSLWLLADAQPMAIPLGTALRVDVYGRMSRGRSAWRWTRRAFVVGAALGAVTCLVETEDCKSGADESNLEAVTAGAVFLAVGLAPLGALGGALFPGNRWRQIRPPFDMRIVVAPLPVQFKVAVVF